MVKNNENHHHLLQRRWRHLLRYISLFNITPIRLRHGSSGRGGGGGIIPGLPGGGGGGGGGTCGWGGRIFGGATYKVSNLEGFTKEV